jgi:hypothetical protein
MEALQFLVRPNFAQDLHFATSQFLVNIGLDQDFCKGTQFGIN